MVTNDSGHGVVRYSMGVKHTYRVLLQQFSNSLLDEKWKGFVQWDGLVHARYQSVEPQDGTQEGQDNNGNESAYQITWSIKEEDKMTRVLARMIFKQRINDIPPAVCFVINSRRMQIKMEQRMPITAMTAYGVATLDIVTKCKRIDMYLTSMVELSAPVGDKRRVCNWFSKSTNLAYEDHINK